MVHDELQPKPAEARAGRQPKTNAQSAARQILILAIAFVVVAAGSGFLAAPFLKKPVPDEQTDAQNRAQQDGKSLLFRGWPRPDVALVLTGEQHGYLQPCGCSDPQKGGLARRYNFIKTLREERKWQVVAADLGDLPQLTGPQRLLKYEIAMQAHRAMNYAALSIGKHEIDMPLIDALAQYSLNSKSPRVLAANLKDREKNFEDMLTAWESAGGDNGSPRVAFVGLVGPELGRSAARPPEIQFDDADGSLTQILKDAAVQAAELRVLLFQGKLEEAKALAPKFPQFQVVVCQSKEEDPSAIPVKVGGTIILGVGHRGKYVGVVGAFRTKQADRPFEFRYELVEISPEYETPAGQDDSNPIHALLEEYARRVHKDNYLAKYALENKHPVQVQYPESKFVGSEKCKKCHQAAYDIWKDHRHSHAYDALVNAKRPALRQYDGECVVCHTVGFGYQSGYRDEKETGSLKHVGCESCHGPSSLHVENSKDLKIRAAINPVKRGENEDESKFLNRLHVSCAKCHDQDNSVHFEVKSYWLDKKTVHMIGQD